MTAPSPAGLSPLLDQLDEAHERIKAGGWPAWQALVDISAASPQLTAAIRGVLDKHRPIGGPCHFDGDESDYCDDDGFIWPCPTVATVTAALTLGADTAGATA